MSINVVMTVTDRPWYLKPVLQSWRDVRGIEDISFTCYVEPTDFTEPNVKLIEQYFPSAWIIRNSRVYGSQVNPWWAFEDSFRHAATYTILAEDDLIVSDDILEYHSWASREYRFNQRMAMVCSYSELNAAPVLEDAVMPVPGFASVWVWGTWWDRWFMYLRDNWDKNYQFGTGEEKGWDWHFNKRVLPQLNKSSIQPFHSRVQNIGVDGTHGSAVNYRQSGTFVPHREPMTYRDLTL